MAQKNNRRLMYLSAISFTTSIMGFMIVQMFGEMITSFSEWTLTQSSKTPAEFPFVYISEMVIYSVGLFIGAVFFIWLLMKLRMIK